MKEIGENLKEARENIGLSIEEVASDLKLRPSQVENIEAGNVDAFKDIFYLKSLIKEYAKYLGMSYEDMVDEFNEYLFDRTSRISIEDIKKAKKKALKKQKKEARIASPYTIERRHSSLVKWIMIILIVLLLIVGSIIVFNMMNNDQINEENTIALIK